MSGTTKTLDVKILDRELRIACPEEERGELLDAVADGDEAPSPRMVDVFIAQLRQKMEPDRHHPSLILTVREYGYQFRDLEN